MMSLPVWLPGPIFLWGVCVPGPMFLQGALPQGDSLKYADMQAKKELLKTRKHSSRMHTVLFSGSREVCLTPSGLPGCRPTCRQTSPWRQTKLILFENVFKTIVV